MQVAATRRFHKAGGPSPGRVLLFPLTGRASLRTPMQDQALCVSVSTPSCRARTAFPEPSVCHATNCADSTHCLATRQTQ